MPCDVETHRANLLALFNSALQAVNGCTRVKQYLDAHPPQGDVYLIAIGKAAASMTDGALRSLGEKIVSGLVITKHGHGNNWRKDASDSRIVCLEAGHPLPDEHSLHAGNVLLNFIDATPGDAQFLFLISGGASALVEVPIAGIGLPELLKVNTWLLGAGLDIYQMNRVRTKLSAIKGGRLAQRLNGRAALNLLISDVPDNDPAIIGSGLLVAETDNDLPAHDLPDWVNALLKNTFRVPESGDGYFKSIRTEIIASLSDAMQSAARYARNKGYNVYLHEELLSGDAITTGRRLADQLLAGKSGVYLWGGETTVQLPSHSGRGGRNQTLALAAALKIKNRRDIVFLAAGTDGTDGPTDDAGAIVDGMSIMRGEGKGLSAGHCLATANAGAFLEASGDLIHTGPTGTNVMDLAIGIKF